MPLRHCTVSAGALDDLAAAHVRGNVRRWGSVARVGVSADATDWGILLFVWTENHRPRKA